MHTFIQSAYEERTFKDIHDPAAQVEGILFQGCTFDNCHFAESMWHQCRFENCTFKSCDLSLVKLPKTRFKVTRFMGCRLVGVNWCDADWEKGSLLTTRRMDFEDCLLDHTLFIGLDLKETGFRGCRARGGLRGR